MDLNIQLISSIVSVKWISRLHILKYVFLHFQIIPPPPPICPDSPDDDDTLGSMLISWYMSGYHTGYYMVSDHSASFPNTVVMWLCCACD